MSQGYRPLCVTSSLLKYATELQHLSHQHAVAALQSIPSAPFTDPGMAAVEQEDPEGLISEK